MTKEKYQEYACQYEYDDHKWCIEIHARSWTEAEQRLKAIADGEVLGPIGAVILVPSKAAIAPMKWVINRAISLLNFMKP